MRKNVHQKGKAGMRGCGKALKLSTGKFRLVADCADSCAASTAATYLNLIDQFGLLMSAAWQLLKTF